MSDNIDIRLFHRLHICPDIFFGSVIRTVAGRMDACHNNVKFTAGLLGKIDAPVRSHNIYLCAHQQPHSEGLSWHYVKILKIKQPACPRHLRGMLGDCNRFQASFSCCRRHLLDGTVCMSARQCMGMCICYKFHIFHLVLSGVLSAWSFFIPEILYHIYTRIQFFSPGKNKQANRNEVKQFEKHKQN